MPRPEEWVKVSVPASVANLGPGFDCLAAAVALRAEVTLARSSVPSVSVAGANVAQDPTNLIYRSAMAVAAPIGYGGAFTLRADFPIPLRAGLGSSAAAIVGGVVGASCLLGLPHDPARLLATAVGLEGHPDNVAAALFGGVAIVVADGPQFRWTTLRPQLALSVVVAIPAIEIETVAARRALPDRVSRPDAIYNLGHVSLLVAALSQGRTDLLREALHDRLHQPYRASLVPGFGDVVRAAVDAGAYGAVLSGSGPAIAAFAPPIVESTVGHAMREAFGRAGVRSRVVVTSIDAQGALETAGFAGPPEPAVIADRE